MRMYRIVCTAILIINLMTGVFSQQTLRIGDWKAHLPFRSGHHITQNQDYIFYSTEFGLVRIDKTDLNPKFITKVDGLNGVRVKLAEVEPVSGALLVVYQNSEIDIVYPDGEIINLNDIPRNDNIPGDRSINSATFDEEGICYLSCSFGVVALDIARAEFRFTTFTNARVNDLAIYLNKLYAATEAGLYSISLDQSLNVADFSLWKNELNDELETEHLEIFQDAIHFVRGGNISRLRVGGATTFWQDLNTEIKFLTGGIDVLIAGIVCLSGANCGNHVRVFPSGQPDIFVSSNCVDNPRYAILDESDRLWLADDDEAFRVAETPWGNCSELLFNTPYSENLTEIAVSNNRTVVASGGVNSFFGYLFRDDGFFVLDESGDWSYFNAFNTPLFAQKNMLDFFTVKVHPQTGLVYVGTYWAGLVEFNLETGNAMIYDKFNSSLQGTVGDTARERVSGLAFDQDNNLWITNYLASRPISVLTNDGTWQNFAVPTNTSIHQIQVDHNGYKWIVIRGNSEGVLVFDSGTDPEDFSDDRYRIITASNSELPNNDVNCIEVDLDGAVWVGTTEGPVIFECGSNVFDNVCRGFRKKVVQDGIVAFLLGTEDIRTIAVDGANRKWFGTSNGVFVQSADGDEQVTHYNERNSPLLDDAIVDIAINQENGEVFIGTNSGLISIRSEATAGSRVHNPDVLAFPNPVRPDYSGPIAIKGLPRDANVKITDINGQLVFETTATGGQAIWYGTDFNGQRVATGVYLVFSSSTPGALGTADAEVTKILFIR